MIRIITDSAADFEPAELEKLNIHCIPLSVQIGEAVYHENVDLSKAQFYTLLAQSGALPKTSQPALQTVLDVWGIFSPVKERITTVGSVRLALWML